jgi:ubiquinone biosynthesis accessory factor UbiJ
LTESLLWSGFLGGVEIAANQILALDPLTGKKLASLDGRVVCLSFSDLQQSIYFLPSKQKLIVMGGYDGQPTSTLTGTTRHFIQRLSSNDAESLFNGDLLIQGDFQVVKAFSDLLMTMDIDWEEHLSHFVGDSVAHQVGLMAKNVQQTLLGFRQKLTADSSEYIQEEARLSPSSAEMLQFTHGVEKIRLDVDRLEARLNRLL